MIRVVMFERVPIFRDALIQTFQQTDNINFECMTCLNEVMESIRKNPLPDILIIDASQLGNKIIDVIKRAKELNPDINIITLVETPNDPRIPLMFDAGVICTLTSSIRSYQLIGAINAISNGFAILDVGIVYTLLRGGGYKILHHKAKTERNLTEREMRILLMVANGMTNEDIALQVGASTRTIKGHLVNICAKLGVNSRWEAVLAAVKRGMLQLGDIHIGEPFYDGGTELVTVSDLLAHKPVHDISNILDMEKTFGDISEGLYLVQNGVIITTNQKLADILNYKQEELIGKRSAELIPSFSRPQMVDFGERRIAGEPLPCNYEMLLNTKDGVRIPVRISVNMVNYQGRKAVIGLVSDARQKAVKWPQLQKWLEKSTKPA